MAAKGKNRPARVVPMANGKKPGKVSVEELEKQANEIIMGLSRELDDAVREVGQLTLRNKRQEQMILQLQQQVQELEKPTGVGEEE